MTRLFGADPDRPGTADDVYTWYIRYPMYQVYTRRMPRRRPDRGVSGSHVAAVELLTLWPA
ncbi:hypothetical protein Kisp02_00330 [Kineosporia sp. NBRC 101731]|nr:hypothetical protein Kisp02_00330 [Kineosporia sp. NBRC 101731]